MAFASMSMGRYIPLDSFVHSLDPRAKLLAVTAAMAAVFPADGLAPLFFCTAALWGAAKLSGLSLGTLLRSCRPVLFLAFFTLVFNLAAGLWGGAPWPGPLRAGTVAAWRLLLLFSFAALLPLTTAPLELTDGLEALLSRIGRTGFPVHEFAMMMGVALRFIPLLADEADRIVKAQVSRGARLDQGSAPRRLVSFFPVVIPLFIIVFRRAEELALAMEARGYRGGAGRTRRRPLVWKKRDTGAMIFAVSLAVTFNCLRAFLS